MYDLPTRDGLQGNNEKEANVRNLGNCKLMQLSCAGHGYLNGVLPNPEKIQTLNPTYTLNLVWANRVFFFVTICLATMFGIG